MPRPQKRTSKLTPEQVGRKYGFRSGLEQKVADDLNEDDVPFEYEEHTIKFTIPARKARYTPDFVLPNGIVVETKGRFVTEDRKRLKLIKEQFPKLDIRLVFSNPRTRISKQSSTTYAMWCERFGFPYANKAIPQEWIDEPFKQERFDAIEEYRK